MIKATNIRLTFKQTKHHPEGCEVLKGVTCEIEKGRITSFIGRSGAGKTTFLKCIANLHQHYTGQLTFLSEPIRKLSNKKRITSIGFVFQQFNLFSHMTVLKNCMHPLIAVLRADTSSAEKTALEMLEKVGMSAYANSYPSHISGGQQQRVAIARALCLNPKVLLFDEPTSALDPESTKTLQDILKKLGDSGVTIALSSHDMPFIKGIIDKIYFLEDGVIVDVFNREHDAEVKKGKIFDFLAHG